MRNRLIALYALGGANKQYVALGYYEFREGYSTENMMEMVKVMVDENPSIREIYQVDQRPLFRDEFRRSRKEHSIESCMIFRDLMQRSGWKVFG